MSRGINATLFVRAFTYDKFEVRQVLLLFACTTHVPNVGGATALGYPFVSAKYVSFHDPLNITRTYCCICCELHVFPKLEDINFKY